MKQAHRLICLNAAAALVLGGGALGGCASADGQYPSLAVRDAERVQGNLTPTSPADKPSDPDQPSVIAAPKMEPLFAALDKARSAHDKFSAQQDTVRKLAAMARNAGPEDDTRARALIGLAALISWRGETAGALSDVDLLEVKAAMSFARTVEIRELQAEILKMIENQDAAIESLSEALDQ